jgi:hypothetical protein
MRPVRPRSAPSGWAKTGKLVAKARADAFEGRYFSRPKAQKLLVQDAWNDYQPISKRDNDTWQTEQGRAKHLNRHLGQKLATALPEALGKLRVCGLRS